MAKYTGPARRCYDCDSAPATENLGKRLPPATRGGERGMLYVCEDCAKHRLGKVESESTDTEQTPTVESTQPPSRTASFEAGHQKGPQIPPEQLSMF